MKEPGGSSARSLRRFCADSSLPPLQNSPTPRALDAPEGGDRGPFPRPEPALLGGGGQSGRCFFVEYWFILTIRDWVSAIFYLVNCVSDPLFGLS